MEKKNNYMERKGITLIKSRIYYSECTRMRRNDKNNVHLLLLFDKRENNLHIPLVFEWWLQSGSCHRIFLKMKLGRCFWAVLQFSSTSIILKILLKGREWILYYNSIKHEGERKANHHIMESTNKFSTSLSIHILSSYL